MWAQIINTFIGLLITISPAVLHFSKIEADNSHLAGPLIITVAVTAIGEHIRNVRLFNIFPALWLMIAPFIFSFNLTASITDLVAGIMVIIFSLFKGKIKKRYGGGWRSLREEHPLHMQNYNQQK